MVLDSLKEIFSRKKEPSMISNLPKLETPKPVTAETASTENVKAKMDLLMTQIESLNVKYETLNQRLANIERMVQEIYVIAKRS